MIIYRIFSSPLLLFLLLSLVAVIVVLLSVVVMVIELWDTLYKDFCFVLCASPETETCFPC